MTKQQPVIAVFNIDINVTILPYLYVVVIDSCL
jgi:hypothetical protein